MAAEREPAQTEASDGASPFPSVTLDATRFRILRRLGAGGFGVVYLVRDLASGADVALKTIPAARAELVYRLKREFRALADLRHENLVSFHELFAADDQVFLTMEYVPGVDFLRHVRCPGLDERRLRQALGGLAAGLSALHRAGKLHRDVKPSNVLVTPEERVVLLDFGLVTDVIESDLGRSLELAGTPEYMSPEHARNASLSPASDWWSVGVLLHQALTGDVPFQRSSPEAELERERSDPAHLLDRLRDAPPDLATLCASLLAYEPSRRAGADEILAVVGRESNRATERDSLAEPPFVGRDLELLELHQALGRVKRGELVTVLLDGSSGVGKTSLARRFLAESERRHDAVVLRGRCYERETVPYAGFDSLTDDLCRFLHGLDAPGLRMLLPRNLGPLVRVFSIFERIPEIALQAESSPPVSPDRQEVRRQAFGAFRELLARIADRRLLILHLDDLQWGDRDTAALIREIVRPPDAPRLLLVLSFRSEERERSLCLMSLLEGEALAAATRIHLGPLSEYDSEALVKHLLAGSGREVAVGRLARDSEGNPFLIHELARFVANPMTGAISDAPIDVRLALRARLDRLPPTARNLLEVVAVAGHPVPEFLAWRAAGQFGPAAGDSTLLSTQCLVRTSLREGERLLEPFHDRIREAITGMLSHERSRAYHRGLAEALEASDATDPEVLAWHYESAGEQARALEFLVRAGSQANRMLAFDRAARHFQRALTVIGERDPRRIELVGSLAQALANSGRSVEAASLYLEAARASPENRNHFQRRAAEQLMFAGKIKEAMELIRRQLRSEGYALPGGPKRAVLSVVMGRVRLRVRGLAPSEGPTATPERLEFLEHLRRLSAGITLVTPTVGAAIGMRFSLEALSSGDSRMVALATWALAGHSMPRPYSKHSQYLFDLARSRVDAVADPRLLALMRALEGFREWCGGNWREVVRVLEEADPILRQQAPEAIWELWMGRSFVHRSLFFLGRWKELRRRLLAAVSHARECGHIYGMAVMVANVGMGAWLVHDEVAAARRTLREIASLWTCGLQQFWFLAAETLLDLYVGEANAAWARLQAASTDIRRSVFTAYPVRRLIAHHVCGSAALAAAAALRSSSQEHRSLLRRAAGFACRLDRVPGPSARPLAELLHAGVAFQRGDSREAKRRLDSGIRALDLAGMRAHADAARRHLARLSGHLLPEFLAGEGVVDPKACARMLVPGFPSP